MAKYKKQKLITTKSAATRYLVKKAGAAPNVSKVKRNGKTTEIRRSGIMVTGKLKQFARESAYNRELLSALRLEAEMTMNLAEKRLETLEKTYVKVSDEATAKLLQDYISRYINRLQSLSKATSSNRSAIQLVNRMEDLINYNESYSGVIKSPKKYFSDYKNGVIVAVINNLFGTNQRIIKKEDFAQMLKLADSLGLSEYSRQMNEAYDKWEATNVGSDQFSIILQNLGKNIKSIVEGSKFKRYSESRKSKFKEFQTLAEQYNLW